MTPAAWFTLAVLSPLFIGFLYLPYRQAREGGALRPHSAGGWLALSALLALPTTSPRAFEALGWVLLGFAWAVFGVLVSMHNG